MGRQDINLYWDVTNEKPVYLFTDVTNEKTEYLSLPGCDQ